MTRRIAVEIGNATDRHCVDCPRLKNTLCLLYQVVLDFNPAYNYDKTKPVMAKRCTACRKAEIREEVKP
jgi:hypothetical protein